MHPDLQIINGLFRVLRQENEQHHLVTLALEDTTDSNDRHVHHIIRTFEATALRMIERSYEPEYVETQGLVHSNRLIEANYLNQRIFQKTSQSSQSQRFGDGPPLKMNVRTPRLFDSLEFVEDTANLEPIASDEIEVEVQAVGINFKDCLTVLGRLDATTLGFECAGLVTRVANNSEFQPGDRVSMLGFETYRTYARSHIMRAIKIPDSLSFIEAASIPVTFCTAYYALCEVARIGLSDSILIHAASGGTGQAAIQIANNVGAEIFATVGSERKKKLLQDLYQIPADHIFYSRDTSFAQGVMRMTKARGVDVILNSSAGEKLAASWECIAPYGRFLEIGRKYVKSNRSLAMSPFLRNVSFSCIDLAAVAMDRPLLIQKCMRALRSLIVDGHIHPAQPLHTFGISEVEKAFRLLQSGESSGKIVVEVEKTAIRSTGTRLHVLVRH